MRIVLASGSPRRLDLLRRAGYEVVVHPSRIEEVLLTGERPDQHAERLAREKALAVVHSYPGDVVLGADTIVVAPGGRLLGKPVDLAEAGEMLRSLAGKTHQVLTGVCICGGPQTQAGTINDSSTRCVGRPPSIVSWVTVTDVTFRQLDSATIDRYIRLVDTLDKAGGYAIQEYGDMLVQATRGSVSNVIGLPMEDLKAILG